MLTVLAHLAGWVLFFALLLGFLYNGPDQPGNGFFGLLTHPWFVLFAILYITVYYTNTGYLVPQLYLKKQYVVYWMIILAIMTGLFFLKPFDHVISVVHQFGDHGLPADMPDLGSDFPEMKMPMKKPTGFRFDITSIILYFMVVSLGLALRLIRQWRETEQRALRAETEKAQAELSFLKAQINPHFLFNTLNNIYSMVMVQHENAADAVMKLSNIMRYITDEIRTDLVPLNSEISCIEDYIALQRMRLAENTSIKIEVSGETGQQQIAPLLLMTFVENAFKYGVSNHENTIISIRLEVNGPVIHFTCTNKLFPLKSYAERSGIGIDNARRRLAYLYPQRHKLEISQENELYTVKLLLQS